MRIAVLACDNFSVQGGAERLIIDFSRALGADVVVPTFNEQVIKSFDERREINFISLKKELPTEPLRQLSGMRLFSKINLDYDFYICTDDMSLRYLAHEVPHFYFMHTPRRAMYDMYYPFLSEYRGLKKFGYWGALNLFKFFDRRFVNRHVKNIACNSHNVRNRIYKIYQRDAKVLYPPIHMKNYSYAPSENYWLSVGRVDKWKRIPLQIEAFRDMPDKTLLIVGKIYPIFRDLVNAAPRNVKFLGSCDEDRLIRLYSQCEGFITTAIDEDFGITPLEAMASGKPVVAVKEGGYLETVIDGHTGILVSPNTRSIRQAVCTVSEDPEYYKNECINRARHFDFSVFKKTVLDYVDSCIKE
jgi:glycosyltransferase involved in cell wall biosynthesis